MAKGKKTVIKEIKLLDNNELMINDKEYVIIENTDDIQTAKVMKISSNGNRILKFDDESKKARIDVKRDLNIVKYTFTDPKLAKKFSKGHDRTLVNRDDMKKILKTSNCHYNARNTVASFSTKGSKNYDIDAGKSTFYLIEEV